ncbi:hypothetical protein ACQ4PT_070136 [Festuca glaucescens]
MGSDTSSSTGADSRASVVLNNPDNMVRSLRKRRTILGIQNLEDAHDAGGKDSDSCTLILTEGESAKSLAMAGLSVLGKERFGVYALRGKFLNVKEASKSRIQKNQEIQDIVNIMGLEFDKEYENTASLRYGHIMFLTDQDEDGAHIKGLLICFFHTFWHSLLKYPSFISQFVTPVIKVTSIEDNSVMSFYSIGAFETWKTNIGGNMRVWAFKYYKGIATHTAEEMISYFEDIANHRKVFSWVDERVDESIDLAFSKKKISKRKEWMLTEKILHIALMIRSRLESLSTLIFFSMNCLTWSGQYHV